MSVLKSLTGETAEAAGSSSLSYYLSAEQIEFLIKTVT